MSILPDDVTYIRTAIANVVLIGQPGTTDWFLVDAGMPTFADNIARVAGERFGEHPPRAILLTHGHFDHVGSLDKLLEMWNVPVYAHSEELPYLTGKADYPEGNPSVGGGLMALVSPLYPHKGIDISSSVRPLPEDGTIPGLRGWRWIHVPGHTAGQVAFFRESDRTLIAADAIITVKQESVFAVLVQEEEIHGPPAYFTFDWENAKASVQKLAALKPAVAITGHGVPMGGEALEGGLAELVLHFEERAVPNEPHLDMT